MYSRRLSLLACLAVSLAACHGALALGEDIVEGGSCLEISLTGTQGGPPLVSGLAGAGTLVRYGSQDNGCSDVVLQFDAGRGTAERLSELGTSPLQLDAVFLTHLHSDHSEGLAGVLQYRWHFLGGPLDVVCAADVVALKPDPGRTMSCAAYLDHIGDAFLASGEITQRHIENRKRDPAGPAAIARHQSVKLPLPRVPGTVVWSSGDVRVSVISTNTSSSRFSSAGLSLAP